MSTGYSSLFTSGLAPADSLDLPNNPEDDDAENNTNYHILDGISVLDPPIATTINNDHRYHSTHPVKASRARHSSWAPFPSKPPPGPQSFAPSFSTTTSPSHNNYDTRSIASTASRGYASTRAGAIPSPHPGYAKSISGPVASDNASFISFKSSRSSKRNSSSFSPSFGAPSREKGKQRALTVLTSSTPITSRSSNVPPQTPPPHSALPSVPGYTRSHQQHQPNHPAQRAQLQPEPNYYSSHHRKPSNASSSRDKRRAKHTSLSFLSMSDSPLDVIPEPRKGMNYVDHEDEEDEGRSSPDTIIMQYSSRNTPTPTTATSNSSFAFARPTTYGARSVQSPLVSTPYSSYPAVNGGQYAYKEPSRPPNVPVAAPLPQSLKHQSQPAPARSSAPTVPSSNAPTAPVQRERTISKLSKGSANSAPSKTQRKDDNGASGGGGSGGMLSRLFSFSSRKGR